eukprot:3628920-Pleurochrysis_carterae.AAC.1
MQCMPAPVSPAHMVLALAAAIAVREVIVDRCVAVGDEGDEKEQEAAHRQSTWNGCVAAPMPWPDLV